jgi:hypothetical protein
LKGVGVRSLRGKSQDREQWREIVNVIRVIDCSSRRIIVIIIIIIIIIRRRRRRRRRRLSRCIAPEYT